MGSVTDLGLSMINPEDSISCCMSSVFESSVISVRATLSTLSAAQDR